MAEMLGNTKYLANRKSDTIVPCPVEHLLLLKGGGSVPASVIEFASRADELATTARVYAQERIACPLAEERHRERGARTARRNETFMLFAYPTGAVGNVVSKGVNELIIPDYKQTWGNIRKLANAPQVTNHLSFKSQEYKAPTT